MERYVAFLRGMNLGNRRIKNDELCAEFEALGFAEIACFRASGNVVFGTADEGEASLAKRIEAGLGKGLGYEVPVFVRGAAELRAITAKEPFDRRLVAASKGKLQVAFLAAKPSRKVAGEARRLSTDDDRLAVEDRELYWLPGGGISESDLDLKRLESMLGPWTMRTKGTVDRIAAKHLAE
jgi:uncharacterized protein (DUF1697 family)